MKTRDENRVDDGGDFSPPSKDSPPFLECPTFWRLGAGDFFAFNFFLILEVGWVRRRVWIGGLQEFFFFFFLRGFGRV
jgi:hypothetical protein